MKKIYGHVVNFIMFQTNLNKFGILCLVLNHLFCGQARFDGLIWLLETIPYHNFCHCFQALVAQQCRPISKWFSNRIFEIKITVRTQIRNHEKTIIWALQMLIQSTRNGGCWRNHPFIKMHLDRCAFTIFNIS